MLQVKQVRGYMKDDNFTLENIKAISSAGAGLLKWVFAMVNYYDVAKGVEPKRKKVADSERSLRIAERDLSTMKVCKKGLCQQPGGQSFTCHNLHSNQKQGSAWIYQHLQCLCSRDTLRTMLLATDSWRAVADQTLD